MKTKFKFSFVLVVLFPLLAISQEFEWVIKPQFDFATTFTDDNLAAVKMTNSWGYVDRKGTWVLKPQFLKAEPFLMGIAAVQRDDKWGFIDSNGRWVIQAQFEHVNDFSEGLAGVCLDNWGFIDKTGNYAFEARFENVGEFSENLAGVLLKGKWGFINKTGAWVIKPKFEDVCVFKDGLAGTCHYGKWGFIDNAGAWVINPKFEDVRVFNEGLAEVKQNGKWGYVDKTGSFVLQPVYANITAFSNGCAAVCQSGKWGYIDKTGAWVIQPQFEAAAGFAEKVRIAQVKQNGKWGYIERPTISSYIKKVVEKNVNEWQKKGEFEKTSEYQKRVNDQTRSLKIQQFTGVAIKQLKYEFSKKIKWDELQLSEYDADNETYLVKSLKLGDFAIPVSLIDAPSFKQNWGRMNFKNPDFTVKDEQFNLAKVTIANPANAKEYLYDSKQPTSYVANNITYNFAPVEVDFSQEAAGQNNSKILSKNTVVGLSDVDTNIPSLQISNPHAYALIFGNEEYSRFQSGLGSEVNVAFAVNDATVFRKYCMSVFGVPESNVKFYANATGGQMNQAIAWINKLIQKEAGEAEVIVYYAGHGLPDEQTREPYIIPVDVSGADLQSAIKLQVLYRKLTEFPSKKITVFMDACFSGGSRGAGLLATRGVKVKPKENALEGNIVVFTSSSGEQSSMPFKEKQHGIFTYYLLKRIQETAGNTSYEELYNYVKKEVDLNCVKVNSKEQTPNLLYPTDLGDNWKAWKLR